MYCTQCGHPITGSFCSNCGAANTPSSTTTTMAPAPPVPMATGAQVVQKTDDMAIVSLILGILSMVMFSIFAGIPAVILGHKSRGRIKRSMGALTGDGIAAGLIMGYLSFLVIPFILIIAAIAIPNLLRARIAANEASAIGSVRTITVAQVSYATNHQKKDSPALLRTWVTLVCWTQCWRAGQSPDIGTSWSPATEHRFSTTPFLRCR